MTAPVTFFAADLHLSSLFLAALVGKEAKKKEKKKKKKKKREEKICLEKSHFIIGVNTLTKRRIRRSS